MSVPIPHGVWAAARGDKMVKVLLPHFFRHLFVFMFRFFIGDSLGMHINSVTEQVKSASASHVVDSAEMQTPCRFITVTS